MYLEEKKKKKKLGCAEAFTLILFAEKCAWSWYLIEHFLRGTEMFSPGTHLAVNQQNSKKSLTEIAKLSLGFSNAYQASLKCQSQCAEITCSSLLAIYNTGIQNPNSSSTFKALNKREDLQQNTSLRAENNSYRSLENDSIVCH